MGELRGGQSGGISRRAQKPGDLRRFTEACSLSTQMEQTPDLGLGDSSLHRYLDGEFWSLKNELRRALGSSPLFQPRYLVELRLLSRAGVSRFAPGYGRMGCEPLLRGSRPNSLTLIRKGSPSRSVVTARCRLPEPLKVSLPPQLSPKIPG